MSANYGDVKSLEVVFERKKVNSNIDYDYEYTRRRPVVETENKVEEVEAKMAFPKNLEAMRGDFERKTEERHVKISNLIEAIKDSTAQEDAATDKFVENVRMMCRFSDDLSHLQKIYSNVLRKLPKVEAK